MRRAAAVASLLVVAGVAVAAPEKWIDPGPKLAPATEGAPHLELEREFVVGSGGGYAIAYDATGTWMASGGTHGDIVLFEAARNRVVARWRPYSNAVESLSFSADGKLLVSGALAGGDDRPGCVYVWDVATRDVVAKFLGGTSTAFSPDGAWFAYERGAEVVLIDAKSLAEIRRFPAGGIERLAVSRDGKRIAVGGGDGHAREFDVDGKPLSDTLIQEGEPVYGVGYLPDGTLAAASRGGKVRIGGVLASVPKSVGALAVSADGNSIAVGESSGFVHLLRPDGTPVVGGRFGPQGGYADQKRWVGAIAFPPKGESVAWIVEGGPVVVAELDWTLRDSANQSEVNSVAFTRDGRFVVASGRETVFCDLAQSSSQIAAPAGFVATGAQPGEIVVVGEKATRLDASTREVLGEFSLASDDEDDLEGETIRYGAWPSPDGSRVVVSAWSGSSVIGAAPDAAKSFPPMGRVFDGAWSADGRTFFAATLFPRMCGNGAREPNVVTFLAFDDAGAVTKRVPVNVDAQSLDLAPSGKVVALAVPDGVQFRDAVTGALVETIPVKTEWWRFVTDDAALVGTANGIALWRRGREALVPLVDGATSGTMSPSRDRLAVTSVGRVLVYRLVR